MKECNCLNQIHSVQGPSVNHFSIVLKARSPQNEFLYFFHLAEGLFQVDLKSFQSTQSNPRRGVMLFKLTYCQKDLQRCSSTVPRR